MTSERCSFTGAHLQNAQTVECWTDREATERAVKSHQTRAPLQKSRLQEKGGKEIFNGISWFLDMQLIPWHSAASFALLFAVFMTLTSASRRFQCQRSFMFSLIPFLRALITCLCSMYVGFIWLFGALYIQCLLASEWLNGWLNSTIIFLPSYWTI